MLQNLAGHHWGGGRCHWEKEDQSWKIYCSTWFQVVFLFLFLIRFPFSLGNYGSNHGIAIFCIFREWGGRNIVPLIVQSSWQNALWQETSLSFFRPEQNVPIPLNTVSQYFLMSKVLFLSIFRTERPNMSVIQSGTQCPNTSSCHGSYFSLWPLYTHHPEKCLKFFKFGLAHGLS